MSDCLAAVRWTSVDDDCRRRMSGPATVNDVSCQWMMVARVWASSGYRPTDPLPRRLVGQWANTSATISALHWATRTATVPGNWPMVGRPLTQTTGPAGPRDNRHKSLLMSEIVAKSATSYMQECCNELVKQSKEARMIVNCRKTKEVIIGPILNNLPPDLLLSDVDIVVDRVSTFKLLGVHVSNDLKWTEHVNAVTKKASSRLHFLKQLKRTGMSDCLAAVGWTSVDEHRD